MNHFQSGRPSGETGRRKMTICSDCQSNAMGKSRERQVEPCFWQVAEMKSPYSSVPLQQKTPSRRQQWKTTWRRCGAASRTGPLNSNHRWLPQWIQTTKRREMGVKEISGKPWLGKTKWRSRENQELYSKAHIRNRNKHHLCIKTMRGTKLSHLIKNKTKRDNLGIFKLVSLDHNSKQTNYSCLLSCKHCRPEGPNVVAYTWTNW